MNDMFKNLLLWVVVAVVLLVIVFRHWRHLLVFTLCLLFAEIAAGLIYDGLSRPRPYGVPVIGRWEGYSAPSPAVLTTTFLLMAGVYCLVVPGRPRTVAKAAVAAVVAVFCLSRLYLAVDHPDDVLSGVVVGVAIPVAAFRYFTPDEVFPVVYRRGRAAHVDVTGSRGAAIRQASVRAESRSGPPGPADRGPGALRAWGRVLDRGQLCPLPTTTERPSVGCRELAWVLRGRLGGCVAS